MLFDTMAIPPSDSSYLYAKAYSVEQKVAFSSLLKMAIGRLMYVLRRFLRRHLIKHEL